MGYYDYTFSFLQNQNTPKPTLVGLGYEFQKMDLIEAYSWDIPLNIVITETQVYRFTVDVSERVPVTVGKVRRWSAY